MTNKKSFLSMFDRTIQNHIELFRQIQTDEGLKMSIQKSAEIVLDAIIHGKAVYFCGNGGSAADSQHIATEFVSKFYKERKAINAEALTVNASSLTAIGNDYSFESIFVRQIEAKAKPGDVLVGISTSGKSKNVTNALDYARSIGVSTIMLTGQNDVSSNYDCIINVPSNDTPRVQEAHICIGHLIAEYVETEIGGEDR